jgi:hypothetical protein
MLWKLQVGQHHGSLDAGDPFCKLVWGLYRSGDTVDKGLRRAVSEEGAQYTVKEFEGASQPLPGQAGTPTCDAVRGSVPICIHILHVAKEKKYSTNRSEFPCYCLLRGTAAFLNARHHFAQVAL